MWVIKDIYESGWAKDKFENGHLSHWSGDIQWWIDGYWITSQTYEDAQVLFERWKKLKAFY